MANMAKMDNPAYLVSLELLERMVKTGRLEHPEHLENTDKTDKLDKRAHKAPLGLLVHRVRLAQLVKQDQVFRFPFSTFNPS